MLRALDARARLGGECQAFDDFSDLLLELLDLLDVLVVDGGHEDQTCVVCKFLLAIRWRRWWVGLPSRRTI